PYSLAEAEQTGFHKTAEVLAFQPGREFTYICADLTGAYADNDKTRAHTPPGALRSNRVRRFLRTLLFLPPDHLIVFDQVDSTNKEFEKTWIIHTVNEPKIEGNRSTVEYAELVFRSRDYPNYSWGPLKYAVRAPQDHPFFQQHPDCKWIRGLAQLYQYDGIMYVRTLLPENARLTTVGGPGKEFWVDGENYGTRGPHKPSKDAPDSLFFHPEPYDITGEAGIWRLEVRPSIPRENDRFLNVFQVGIKSQNPTPTESRLIDANDERTVLEVDLGNSRKATVILKNRVGGHVKIEQAGRTLIDEQLAEKVLPNLPVAE
ncbi:MAG: hypothetical protein N2255_00765, partial [Kiritimatiellae bacterium]|nr:hypothetical protein [Kiritimatiellia bacterium]